MASKSARLNKWRAMDPDTLLNEVYNKFIAIKDKDFELYYNVFDDVFHQVLRAMCNVDNYFQRYSSKIRHVGSHYDNLKIGKPDEFDMDVVIRLPVSMINDVTIQTAQPGFATLRMGPQFMNLRSKPDWESHHKVTANWCDEGNFLLQSSVRHWIEGVVQKAINTFPNQNGKTLVRVGNVYYVIKVTKSGPAFTMHLRKPNDANFKLDIDLVPAFEFGLDKLPQGYRRPGQNTRTTSWYVVPKPKSSIKDEDLKNRSWRLAFEDQEREILQNRNNMKTVIRLMKKLRDRLELNRLSSYSIKTLFLWESVNKEMWNHNLAYLFEYMLKKLHTALLNKEIRDYWNQGCNLIGAVDGYAEKVKRVIDGMAANRGVVPIESLLTEEEIYQ